MASTAVFTALNDAVVKSATQLETSGQITPATTDEDSKSPTPSKDSMGDGMNDPSDALMIVTSDDEEDADDCDALMYPEVKLQEHNDDIATIVSDTNNNDDDVSSQHSIEVTPDIHEGDDHDDDMMANSEATHNLLSSLSTLMAMAANAKNQGKRPSGKLDKITQKLAQKQLNSGESLLNAFSPSSSSAGAPSDSAGTASGSNVDTSPEDECDEEDMQNSLRALGLMGTAADFQTAGEYKCPLCDLKLDTQHSFTLHIRSHNPSDHSNTCQLCGKTLSSASSLDRHMLIHSGERPFKCSICNMAFTTNGNMHRHMRTHGHGAIGYTPRGAKRRAKLFAQQAAKVAAAAAAGEIVDASTLSKLKKAAIEVTTGNGKSPISGEVKKLTRGRRTSDNFEDAVQLNAVQTVIETKTIADAAAAFVSAIATADSKKSKNTPAPVGSPSFVQFPFASQSTLDFEVKPKRKPGRKRKIQPEDGAPEQMSPGSGHMPTNNSHSFNGSSMNNSTVSCPICSLSVSGKMDLHGHMVGFHRQEPLFCLDCGMILDNYDVYIHHQCTFSAAMVMAAIRQNPNMSSEVLFPSTNTGRMNFSSLAAMTGKKPAPAPTSAPAVPAPVTNNASFDALFQSLSQQLQNSQKSQLSPGLVDLSKKVKQSVPQQQQQQQPSPLGGGGGAQCNTCARRFNNTRDLKKHFDTFCHDCSLDCGTSAMFLTHSLSHGFDKFPALSKALSGAQNGQGASPPTTTEQLVASLLAAQGVNPFLNMHQTKTSLSGAGSSLASLTSTMADMTDLADIQSIISMANKANKLPTSATTNNFNKSDPISPNRATDAESGKKMLQMNAGDASHHHPDSPASADSAGIALAHTHHGQSSSTGTAATDSGHESANTNEFATMKDEHFDDDDDEPNLKRARKSDDEEGLDLSVDGTTRKFRCEPCRLSFRSLNAFKRHNRGHTAGGGHSHACTQCPYKSLDKSTLIRHLRTHNGERPFQCSICKYAFTTKANCERHVKKRHRDLKTPVEIRQAMQFNEDIAATAAATRLVAEKIFIERDELPTSQDTVCKQCKVDHGTNKALRAHLRVPNNPCSAELKPFVCTICRVAFNTRNNCVRHILKQHPSTIEVTDEEAAKVVAAVNGQVDTTAESLIRDDSVSGGSGSPSLDNSFMSASGSSDEGEYDDGEPMDSDKSPFASPNASLDALFRVAGVEAESVRRNGGGPLNLSSKSPESKPTPLDFSIKPETSALLSHPSFGQFFGQADMFAHNPGLLALYRAEQEQQKQQQQQQLAAVASAAMSGAFDMSAFAKTFNPAAMLSAAAAPSPLGGVMSANDTLAHLMAQFHQQQQIALKSLSKHH